MRKNKTANKMVRKDLYIYLDQFKILEREGNRERGEGYSKLIRQAIEDYISSNNLREARQ